MAAVSNQQRIQTWASQQGISAREISGMNARQLSQAAKDLGLSLDSVVATVLGMTTTGFAEAGARTSGVAPGTMPAAERPVQREVFDAALSEMRDATSVDHKTRLDVEAAVYTFVGLARDTAGFYGEFPDARLNKFTSDLAQRSIADPELKSWLTSFAAAAKKITFNSHAPAYAFLREASNSGFRDASDRRFVEAFTAAIGQSISPGIFTGEMEKLSERRGAEPKLRDLVDQASTLFLSELKKPGGDHRQLTEGYFAAMKALV